MATFDWGSLALVCIMGGAGLTVLWRSRRHLRGTTLMAPWSWAAFSWISLAGCEAAIRSFAPDTGGVWAEPLRYAAAMTTLCPFMALLGAKRPQDRMWQAVVLTLLAVVLMPAGEALLFRAGQPVRPAAAWSWLTLVLMLLGVWNYLPTRFWLSGLLVFAAQVGLAADYLPFIESGVGPQVRLLCLAILVLAMVLAAAGFPGRRRPALPADRVWIDFRDWFGAVWGLRVAERIRAVSAIGGWGVTLTWRGFTIRDDEPQEPAHGRGWASNSSHGETIPPDVAQALEKSIRGVLRRFVSPDWIARRMHEP